MQGRWGHRRVIKAFGRDILQEDGEHFNPAICAFWSDSSREAQRGSQDSRQAARLFEICTLHWQI